MTQDPSGPHRGVVASKRQRKRVEFQAQVNATRADFEAQVKATRAQFDATNEKIVARTGRNLIFAILIGLALGLALVCSLIFIKEVFMVFAAAAVSMTAFEFAGALRSSGRNVPRIAAAIAALIVVPVAYYFGAEGQIIATLGGIVLIAVWRLAEQATPERRTSAPALLRDLGTGFFVQIYVALFASFAVLLTAQEGGQWWTLAFIALVVIVDTGAYASGLSFGKHPMAPTISPKKTWEGFAGAAAAALVGGVLLSLFMLGQPWWFGLIFGAALLLSATVGDLTESLIKRDIGIKDMSSWLPGHGGLLDRLDSILPSAVVAYVLFICFA